MKHKWTLFTFSRGDFKALERYLNEQAEQGWELERAGVIARWKRTERKDLSYCVDLAKPKQDREDRLDYVEFCAEGGWELVSFIGQMYIFKSIPGRETFPIQTDPEMERKNYNKYYVRQTIQGVLFLALEIALYATLWMVGDNWGRLVQQLQNWLYDSWVMIGFLLWIAVWGLWGLWKVADFIRAMISNRGGKIGPSPRWVLWTNCVTAIIAGAAAVLFFLTLAIETITNQELPLYGYIFTAVWGGIALYQVLEIEKELYQGERRRALALGLGLVGLFAALIVGRALSPYGEWSTAGYDEKSEKGIAKYEQTMDLPLVHGEDLGIPFELGQGENVYITHELTPMGETWELYYAYSDEKTDFHYLTLGSATTRCFTEGTAKLLLGLLVDTPETNRYQSIWPVKGLTPVEIDWADGAWYGTMLTEIGEDISILVLRVGKQVTRLAFPADLMTEENLAAIRAELER